MSKRYSRAIRHNDKESAWDRLAVYVLSFVFAIVPLYLRLYEIELSDTLKKYWTGDEIVYDVFSYVKSQLLICALVVLGLYWIIRIVLKQSIPKHKILIPLLCYVLLAIISTVVSKYIDISLMGFVDRYEGLFVILAYVLIVLTSLTVLKDEKYVMIAVFSLLASADLISIIGISQFFGFDLLQTGLGKTLMVPSVYSALRDTLRFNFAGQKMMYTTLYNPNYTGSYTVLILPISIALFYYYLDKSKGKSVFMFISTILAFVLWLGGLSKAGLVGGIVLFIFLIFFERKPIIKYWKHSIALILSFILIFAGMDNYSDGLVSKEFLDTVPMTIGSRKNSGDTNNHPKKSSVKSATLSNNVFEFATDTEAITMKLEGDQLGFYDEQGNSIKPYQVENIIKFENARYGLYSVEIDKGVAYLKYDDAVMPFVFSEGKMLYAPTSYLYYDEVGPVESVGFENHLDFGSGRGYLWSRSIPLLKDTIFLGHGPDTYAVYFPQQDIAGKINGLGHAILIVDKPHNWYLQIGINTGVLSLIAMLVFLAWYIIKAIIRYRKTENTFDYYIGSASLCAVIGYCIAALANDSNVAIAPVFWGILGIGLVFLYKDKSEVAISRSKS
jgi:hypothetical protein